ncbi:MAG: hypothetical protein Q9218_002955 [Villophora microphyllina]
MVNVPWFSALAIVIVMQLFVSDFWTLLGAASAAVHFVCASCQSIIQCAAVIARQDLLPVPEANVSGPMWPWRGMTIYSISRSWRDDDANVDYSQGFCALPGISLRMGALTSYNQTLQDTPMFLGSMAPNWTLQRNGNSRGHSEDNPFQALFRLVKFAVIRILYLNSLRKTLADGIGFLYIKNTGIDDHLIEDVITQGKAFFDLPKEKKMEVQMKNMPSFLGYNVLGGETTAFKTDWREQIDLSTPHPLPKPTDPIYYNLLAPNQWPDPNHLPSFRPTFESYIAHMSTLSTTFTSFIAEALSLPSTAFDRFFDKDQQHKLKIVKYPDLSNLPADQQSQQGVGPHKDSMLSSYLLQASHHRGLQAQNLEGEWIDCPPIPGTLVVAIGQGLEALTHGICASTTHRVLSPAAGQGARYSIPFFQGVSYDATFESVDVPQEVMDMRDEVLKKQGGRRADDVEFTFMKGRWGHLGEATLTNRVRSHPDVGERWYPDILRRVREEQARDREEKAKAGKAADAPHDLVEPRKEIAV